MSKLPVALVATRLLAFLADQKHLIYVASCEQRGDSIAHLVQELAPEVASVFLPAWECHPYDRASPAPDILGQQLAACRRLDQARAGEAAELIGRAPVTQRSWLHLKGDPLVYARASDTSRERLDLASHPLKAFV